MDNRIFNVNGSGDESLLAALRLVFKQTFERCTAKAYAIDPIKGMVLLWSEEEGTKFPSPLNAEQVLPIVTAWLGGKPIIKCEGWDANADHDGDNSLGWRVYVEDWGHVGNHRLAICAIKPAYLWHGK